MSFSPLTLFTNATISVISFMKAAFCACSSCMLIAWDEACCSCNGYFLKTSYAAQIRDVSSSKWGYVCGFAVFLCGLTKDDGVLVPTMQIRFQVVQKPIFSSNVFYKETRKRRSGSISKVQDTTDLKRWKSPRYSL